MPNTAWCTATNTSACCQVSVATSRTPYATKCTSSRTPSTTRCRGAGAAQRPHARHVQVDRLEGQEREEQPGLVAGRPPGEPATAGRLAGVEHQRARVHVRVRGEVVGPGVVRVVLVDPPGPAHPVEQVAAEQPERQGRQPPASGDLPVPGLVAEEAELGGDDGQDRREQHRPPRVAQHHHPGDRRGQRREVDGQEAGVEARPRAEQPERADLGGQLGVPAGMHGRGGRVGEGHDDAPNLET